MQLGLKKGMDAGIRSHQGSRKFFLRPLPCLCCFMKYHSEVLRFLFASFCRLGFCASSSTWQSMTNPQTLDLYFIAKAMREVNYFFFSKVQFPKIKNLLTVQLAMARGGGSQSFLVDM